MFYDIVSYSMFITFDIISICHYFSFDIMYVPFIVSFFHHYFRSSLFTIRNYGSLGVHYLRPFVLLSLFTIRCYVPSGVYYFPPFVLSSLFTIRRFVLPTYFAIRRFFSRPFVPFDVLSVDVLYHRSFLLRRFVGESKNGSPAISNKETP